MKHDKKRKLDSLAKLQAEKERLAIFCAYQEKLIAMNAGYLRENYPKVIGELLLPYDRVENTKVNNLLDTVNGFITKLFPNVFKGRKFPELILKLAQILVINLMQKKPKAHG